MVAQPHGNSAGQQTGDQATDEAGTQGHGDSTTDETGGDTRATSHGVGNITRQGGHDEAHGGLARGKEHRTQVQRKGWVCECYFLTIEINGGGRQIGQGVFGDELLPRIDTVDLFADLIAANEETQRKQQTAGGNEWHHIGHAGHHSLLHALADA